MKTFKKILCSLLVVVMCLTSAPLQGFVGMKWPDLPEINFGELELPKIDFSSWFSSKAEAASYSGTCGDNLTWSLDTDTGVLTIRGSGNMTSYDSVSAVPWYNYRSSIKSVVLPDGLTSIGGYVFYYCSNIKSITIPDSVTSIDRFAFLDCKNLENVTIGDSVTSIGDYAFSHCRSLKNLTIGSSVISVGDYAFEYCEILENIIIPNSVTSIGDYAFNHCSSLENVITGDSVKTIGDYAFDYCNKLTSITIPNSVISIGKYAFHDCDSLENIIIPDSVTSIGDYAFNHCESIQSVSLGEGVLSIGRGAFDYCQSLTRITVDLNNLKYSSDANGILFNKDKTILIQYPIGNSRTIYTIPNSVISIGDYAFFGCKNLTSITIPNSVTSINDRAFLHCISLKNITVGNSVTSIGESVFVYCKNLTSITIPASVTSIGRFAFEDCESLENITLPNSIISIGEYAFHNCSNLTSITLPNSLTSINKGLFSGCGGLINITIPNSITSIGDYAFHNCSNLTSITLPNSITSISNGLFYDCFRLASITLPESITSIGGAAFYGCSNLANITIPNSVMSIGHSAFKDCTKLTSITIPDSVTSIGETAFCGCTKLTSITLPNKVTSIGKDLFSGCVRLASITIPNSVTSIGISAFEDCESLTSIIIPDNVTSIGSSAFKYCSNLTSITLPNSITSIGNDAFHYCGRLENIKIPDNVASIGSYAFASSKLISIIIPNSVTSIGDHAFNYCGSLEKITILGGITTISEHTFSDCNSLKSVTIPDSVTSISHYAFRDCSSITDVYYEGSEDEWKKIKIDSFNTDLTNATIHYNYVMPDSGSDNDPTATSENFKFDKESYTVKYNSLTDETTNSSITLTYKADISTIESFDDSMITFTVDDPSVFTFGTSLYIKPINPTDTATIYCTVKAKKLGTSTLTATLPDGTTASCKVTVEKYTDDVERFIQIRSTNKALSTEVGDSFKMYFTLMEDGYEDQNWKKVSFAISDPTVISVKINGNAYGSIYDRYTFEVTGLKAGSTNVVVTDSDTGIYEIFTVNIYEPYTQRYNYYVEKWDGFYPNNKYENDLETYAYNINGLYVNNYEWTKAGNKYIISFDVYNSRCHIGAVDVFDADGNWYDSYEIKKYSGIDSIYTWGEEAYYLVKDAFDDKWCTYEQESFAKHTKLKIEVPVGGYFTISNNFSESIGTRFFNLCQILVDAVATAFETSNISGADLKDNWSAFADMLKDEIKETPKLKETFSKALLNTSKSQIIKMTKNLTKEQVEDTYSEIIDIFEDVLNEVIPDWKGVFKTAYGLAESVFLSFAGPIGGALKGCFGILKGVNKFLEAQNLMASINAPYVTVHTFYNGEHISNNVIVEDNGKIDSEAVLQVFRVSTHEYVEVTFDDENPLAIHELYNICFVKDDKSVQPNGKVKVYIPIPKDLKGDTCLVYRQESNNHWTALNAYREDGFLVFETDHFSLYAIVGEKQTISIATKPNKTTYLVNDVLDSTGLTLKVGDEIIDNGFICSPSVLSKNGKQTITVTYMGLTAEFEVEVNTKTSSDEDYQVGDIIQFGSYPQSKVTDSATISALNKLAPEWESWTSYGYYSSDNAQIKQGDWMRYTDIIYNGDRYRGVKFTKYRPSEFDQEDSIFTYQDSNGYYVNEVYWFKFEPICWRVLDSDTGLIMCESIIDSQPFNNLYYENNGEYFNDTTYKKYASDYETSSIRKWLHENFYNTAFTETEKKEIDITVLNNDGYLTSSGSPGYEKYDGDNTSDKIFCLSYNDAKNDKYGFNSDSYTEDVTRRASGSDYAKSQGLDVENDGYSRWLLRSPYTHRSNCLVNHNGWSATMAFVSYTFSGVRPALTLKDLSNLDKEDHIHDYIKNVVSPTCEEDGYTQFKCKCGDTYVYDYVTAKGHSYSVKTIRPTCTENGTTTYTCACGDAYTETISATGHTFDESESKCKNCDYDKADDCSCNCHKGGIKAFFFKLILFFQKIFKKNKICNCGKYHY